MDSHFRVQADSTQSISEDFPKEGTAQSREASTIFGRSSCQLAFQNIARIRSVRGTQANKSCSRFLLKESNPFRRIWTVILFVLLVYVGTIFIFRLCFEGLRLEDLTLEQELARSGEELSAEQDEAARPTDGWNVIDDIMNALFWVDFLVSFVFTYRDKYNQEVVDFKLCVWRYLKTSFAINLIACMPQEVAAAIMNAVVGTQDGGGSRLVSAALRISRLQRLSRLSKITRVISLLKIVTSDSSNSLFSSKGPRVMKLFVGLMWMVHLLACGWYLVAALHDVPTETWVARRKVDAAGEISLMSTPPVNQWMTSMYFVLTVFSTVGFGDISGMTLGEMAYLMMLIIVGIVFHSMIISEVISVLTSSDQYKVFVDKHCSLIRDFAHQTSMTPACEKGLEFWVTTSASEWFAQSYSMDEMWSLINDKVVPPTLLDAIPDGLFNGKLVRNSLFTMCKSFCSRPPQLVVLLSMRLSRINYERRNIVYNMLDFPYMMYMVHQGVFAYVVDPEEELVPYVVFPAGTYFGETEIVDACPRRASVRCETRTGELLSLSRRDFRSLVSEFPEYTAPWVRRVKKREARRIRRLQQVQPKFNYKDIAAVTLQRFFRSPDYKRGATKSKPLSLGVCADWADLPSPEVSSAAARQNEMVFTGIQHASLPEFLARLEEVHSMVHSIGRDQAAVSARLDDQAAKFDVLTKKVDTLSSILLDRAL